ncbi:MAG: phage portal protein [Alistipes sp.]|nr:phage portal protein [Alistipes sp.]
MEKRNTKSMVAVANRKQESLFAVSTRAVENEKFWRWGDDNLLPNALSLMSRRSTTHRRIINDKADYIAGKGFSFDEQEPLLAQIVERANGEGDSLRRIIYRLAFDKALMGNAFLEIVTDPEHSFLSLYHQDASHCRLARDSQHILLHHDWSSFKGEQMQSLPLYPRFEQQADGTLRSIVHYKEYEPMFAHYGVPKYIAGMGVSAIAYKTDCWNISRLDNSFQLSGIMMLDATLESEAEAERLVQTAEKRFAGTPGQVMFVVGGGDENNSSRFIPLESHNEGDWSALHDQATSDIVIAHSWFRSLSGLDYSAGFSAERILHEYEVALNTVILAEQEELLAPIKRILREVVGVNGSSLEIVNRPPTRSKPIYMKVWEARKADGLEYDADDERQQAYLSEITKYNVTKIN